MSKSKSIIPSIFFTVQATVGSQSGGPQMFTLDAYIDPSGLKNVRAFGAKGDGVTDDTNAIQTAINSLNRNETLIFPPGIYIHSLLSINVPFVSLAGSGTLKKKSNVDQVALFIRADGVQVRDLIFDGSNNQAFQNFRNDTIRIGAIGSAVKNAVIRNLTIVNSKGSGISVYCSTGCHIEGNLILNAHDNGILIGGAGANNNRIANNYIHTTTSQNGIFITASPGSRQTNNYIYHNIIDRNVVVNAGDTGIETGIHSVGTIITRNSIRDSKNPLILLRDSRDVVVEKNILETGLNASKHGDGISVIPQTEGDDWHYSSVIRGNRVSLAHGRSGIHIQGNGIYVEKNYIDGIPGKGCTVSSATGKRGITLGTKFRLNKITIQDNNISNIDVGIDGNYSAKPIEISDIHISSNTIANTEIGINLYNWRATQSSISSNTITAAKRKAVLMPTIDFQSGLIIENNNIRY